ncbi:MAG TPA: RluA family pseudouridine synthase, partial [Candidatus Saccharimonadaceae bacterium]|nr:RluA family pseudouridine synthase [Candidatus Saccharimonadaceae bacterium]
DLEDDPANVLEVCRSIEPNATLEIVNNPNDDTATYASRFHSKIVYVAREVSTTRRLDTVLAEVHPEISRSTWQKLIKKGMVTVNGEIETSPKRAVRPVDRIESTDITRPDFSAYTLPIVYKDDNVIVINKPAGLLTHSKGALNDEFTVADFFRRFTSNGLDTNRPGIIHRLDRDTSGIIIGALNDETAKLLKKQFSERTVKKTYFAVTSKLPPQQKGLIDIPIGRNPSAPSTFRADPRGKAAQTVFEVLGTARDGTALVRLQPKTGRTHQLRVHLAHIGCPIIGDRVYGTASDRLMLHAYQLEITIPRGQRRVFTAPIPEVFLENFPEVSL